MKLWGPVMSMLSTYFFNGVRNTSNKVAKRNVLLISQKFLNVLENYISILYYSKLYDILILLLLQPQLQLLVVAVVVVVKVSIVIVVSVVSHVFLSFGT